MSTVAVMLQGKTTELEQILRQKELEIERLQQQLESKKSDGSSDSSVDVCAAVELDEDPSAAYANEASCFPLPVPSLSSPLPHPTPLRSHVRMVVRKGPTWTVHVHRPHRMWCCSLLAFA